MEASVFICSICGDPSREICVYCTNDACANHLCERCHRCSDCCACDMPVFSQQVNGHAVVEPPVSPVPPDVVSPSIVHENGDPIAPAD